MNEHTQGATVTSSRDPRWAEPPGLGRTVAVGSIIGVVVSFVGVTIGVLALGVEGGSAIGIGLFVAFWGGLGFGTMVGGVIYAFSVEAGEAHVDHEAGDDQVEHDSPEATTPEPDMVDA